MSCGCFRGSFVNRRRNTAQATGGIDGEDSVEPFFFPFKVIGFEHAQVLYFGLFCTLAEQLLGRVNHISYSQLRSATDDFHSSNKIGRGGFGTVYKVLENYLMFITLIKVELIDTSD